MAKQTIKQLLEKDLQLEGQRSKNLSPDPAVANNFRQEASEFLRELEEKALTLTGLDDKKGLADIAYKWRLNLGLAGEETHRGKKISWVDDEVIFELQIDDRRVPAVRLGEGQYYTPMLPHHIFPTAAALARTYAEAEGQLWMGPSQNLEA